MERSSAAEAARDSLTAEVARLRQAAAGGSSAAGPPSSPGGAQLKRESEAFELRLERDQLQAQVRRLKERLAEVSAEAGEAPGAATGRRATSTGPRGAAGAGTITAAREAELLSTITNLKAALEKANANTTPTTKYMAEVQRRKEAQRDAEANKVELERLRQQLNASGRMVAELQSANAELRRQVRAVQAQAAAAAQGQVQGGVGQGGAELGAQVGSLEMLLGQREEEVAALRGALAQRDAELEALRGPGGAAAGPHVSTVPFTVFQGGILACAALHLFTHRVQCACIGALSWALTACNLCCCWCCNGLMQGTGLVVVAAC